MTAFKGYPEEKPNKQENFNKKIIVKMNMNTKKMEKHFQYCAWLLLTLGICIFFTTFYLTIKHIADTKSGRVVENHENVYFFDNEKEELIGIEPFGLEEREKNFNTNARLSLSNLYEKIEQNRSRCKEDLCQIACANVADIFTALHDTVMNSLCSSIDVLLLENPYFALGILKNYWLPANISFNEVIIRLRKTTTIKSDAFNSPLFQGTLVLSLNNKVLMIIESGALLGFQRLKYLTIQSPIKEFQSSILQPVQNTLLCLKLNGHIKINGTENIFEGINLNSLAYLDLSHNIFNGSLGNMIFASTPNLKYLIITQSQIEHLEENAFERFADKLLFVNLSKNRLTTLAPTVFEPILVGKHKAVINLVDNVLVCDCLLQQFAKFYQTYNLQFMHVLYCKGPHHLYGVSLDEVDFGLENCLTSESTEINLNNEIKSTTLKDEETFSQEITTIENREGNHNNQEDTNVTPFNVKMNCFEDEQISKHQQFDGSKRQNRATNDKSMFMEFPAPDYEFDLELIEKNNNVIVTVEKPGNTFLVIWFSEEQESSVISYGNTDLDYECVLYAQPQLIVGPLQENTTYTICVLSSLKTDISPFNCLPLHVPAKRNQNLWILEDKKRLTIGMLSLIFLLSTIAGAVISYFGLKNYPELLEGSKNVLIVKKNDHPYVTTISEIEYQKQSSLNKHKPCSKQHPFNKLPLPETPLPKTGPSPFPMSVKDLERISSVKSPLTCVEETLPSYNLIGDDYETPKICSDEYSVEQQNVKNIYCATPKTPPPLPKRNSNVSNCSTLVLSRLSKNRDVL